MKFENINGMSFAQWIAANLLSDGGLKGIKYYEKEDEYAQIIERCLNHATVIKEDKKMKKLTPEQIADHNGDYKTIFGIEHVRKENDAYDTVVHIYGYCYYADDGTDKPYRLCEYTFFFVPLKEVLEKGIIEVEREYGENYKQYLTDICWEDIYDIYRTYNNGDPVKVLPRDKFNQKTKPGIYILED